MIENLEGHRAEGCQSRQGTLPCPKCGEEQGNLPLHLPNCDGDGLEGGS
jgi:hypothetical protein